MIKCHLWLTGDSLRSIWMPREILPKLLWWSTLGQNYSAQGNGVTIQGDYFFQKTNNPRTQFGNPSLKLLLGLALCIYRSECISVLDSHQSRQRQCFFSLSVSNF